MSQFPKDVEEKLNKLLVLFNDEMGAQLLRETQVLVEECARLRALDPAIHGETVQWLEQLLAQITALPEHYERVHAAVMLAFDAREHPDLPPSLATFH